MSNIVLPGGVANIAVNVSMMHKTSPFLTVLNSLAGDASQLAPFSACRHQRHALQGFSKFYGYLENRTTFLFQAGRPPAFATRTAAREANTSIGMNLPEGDYILVPQAHTDDLKPYLDKLTLSNGYLVAKDDKGTSSVYERAEQTKPDISYVTMHVAIKPIIQTGVTAASPSTPAAAPPAAAPAKKSTTPH